MRVLPQAFIDGITSPLVTMAVFADLTFKSSTQHVWSGVGSLVFNGTTYLGMGLLGKVGNITESIELAADGTTLSLSGIDPTLLTESLNDVQLGAPATVWLAVIAGGVAVGFQAFGGQMDAPTHHVDGTSITISIALENKLVNLQRPSARRYTTEDQYIDYPDDCGFSWVPMLNDLAIKVDR